MIDFETTATGVELEYEGNKWTSGRRVWDELTAKNEVYLSRIFCFDQADLLNPPTRLQDPNDYKSWPSTNFTLDSHPADRSDSSLHLLTC